VSTYKEISPDSRTHCILSDGFNHYMVQCNGQKMIGRLNWPIRRTHSISW